MLTRRQLLTALTLAPLLPELPNAAGVHFIEEPHALAAESVRGYRSLASLAEKSGTSWIIAPGICDMTPQVCASLLTNVCSGVCLLLESGLCFASHMQAKQQLEILWEGFGLQILPPVQTHSYVRYSWPVQKSVRTFQAVTPVLCHSREVIADLQGLPVCMKRNKGRGCIIYLGSMLGPGLMAEEREAHVLGNVLLSSGNVLLSHT